MGEYAIRKSDNQKIKIGVCECNYYLRHDDKDKVLLDNHSGFGCYYRLPYPDEDNIKPGNYEESRRGLMLYKAYPGGTEYFSDPETATEPGTIQIHHESGLLINVKCYHGEKLPEQSKDFKPFWNGKGHHLELAYIKEMNGELHPIVRCRFCNKMWSYTWAEILPYVYDEEMHARLEFYALTVKTVEAV